MNTRLGSIGARILHVLRSHLHHYPTIHDLATVATVARSVPWKYNHIFAMATCSRAGCSYPVPATIGGLNLCAFHLPLGAESPKHGKRVRCTVDSSHTVWSRKLARHVKQCAASAKRHKPTSKPDDNNNSNNKKKMIPQAEAVSHSKVQLIKHNRDIRSSLGKGTSVRTLLQTLLACPVLDELLCYNVKLETSEHESFAQLFDPQQRQGRRSKHYQQESSLLQCLDVRGWLYPSSSPALFIEFGCGKAGLSHHLLRATAGQHSLLLVDRQNFGSTNKSDPQMRRLWSSLSSAPQSSASDSCKPTAHSSQKETAIHRMQVSTQLGCRQGFIVHLFVCPVCCRLTYRT